MTAATMIDTKQLQATTMTPRVDDTRRGPSEQLRSLAAMAAIPAATDKEAAVPEPPPLCLTAADIEHLQNLARRVNDMRAEVTKADQALAAATAQARMVAHLEQQAGALAAQAFRGGSDDKASVKSCAADIEDARAAAAAVAPLTRERDDAVERYAAARGKLRATAVEALRQSMLRASKRYADLSLQVTECVAAISAGIEASPSRIQSDLIAGWSHVLQDLSLPAPPPDLRVNNTGVAEMYFRESLLRVAHSRLVWHTSAATGRLRVSLAEAVAPSGIPVSSLLA